MQQGMSEMYCETLTNWAGTFTTKDVVLLHDNMRLHTTARTRALLEYFN
jgi:hypothetical protein